VIDAFSLPLTRYTMTHSFIRLSPSRLLAPIIVTCGLLLSGCAASKLSVRETDGRDLTAYMSAVRVSSFDQTASAQPAALPASIAIAQVGEVAPPDEMLDTLREQTDLFTDVQGISGDDPRGRLYRFSDKNDAAAVSGHLESMLSFASNIGADYLVVYGGTIDASEGGTPLRLLDLTIVGAFILPGHELVAEAKASAIVLDVRSGLPLTTATASDDSRRFSSSVGLSGARAKQMRSLRDSTINEMTEQLIERFSKLETAASARR
jgi:hypothetical protein